MTKLQWVYVIIGLLVACQHAPCGVHAADALNRAHASDWPATALRASGSRRAARCSAFEAAGGRGAGRLPAVHPGAAGQRGRARRGRPRRRAGAPRLRPDQDLLGLYEGINRLDRASGYHLATPDRITLFWRPIVEEVGSADREAIRREVRKTIIHEVAHHFGIDDAELERLGG